MFLTRTIDTSGKCWQWWVEADTALWPVTRYWNGLRRVGWVSFVVLLCRAAYRKACAKSCQISPQTTPDVYSKYKNKAQPNASGFRRRHSRFSQKGSPTDDQHEYASDDQVAAISCFIGQLSVQLTNASICDVDNSVRRRWKVSRRWNLWRRRTMESGWACGRQELNLCVFWNTMWCCLRHARPNYKIRCITFIQHQPCQSKKSDTLPKTMHAARHLHSGLDNYCWHQKMPTSTLLKYYSLIMSVYTRHVLLELPAAVAVQRHRLAHHHRRGTRISRLCPLPSIEHLSTGPQTWA